MLSVPCNVHPVFLFKFRKFLVSLLLSFLKCGCVDDPKSFAGATCLQGLRTSVHQIEIKQVRSTAASCNAVIVGSGRGFSRYAAFKLQIDDNKGFFVKSDSWDQSFNVECAVQ